MCVEAPERLQRSRLELASDAAAVVRPASRRSAVQLRGAVHVLEPMIVPLEELAQRDLVGARRAGPHERRPPRPPHRRLEVVEDDLAALAIEVDACSRRAGTGSPPRPARRRRRACVSRIARRRSSKRNSRRCWPIRSMTVRWLLPAARRSPRPSCCVNTVDDDVGRSSSRQSTSGTSTPSPSTSTEKTQRSRPARRACRPVDRRSAGASSPVSATLSRPASVNLRAM